MLVNFENTYRYDGEGDAKEVIVIDGYPADENKEGTVVAEIILTKSGDTVVSWHDNSYRANETVLELIEESKNQLKGSLPEVSDEVIKTLDNDPEINADGFVQYLMDPENSIYKEWEKLVNQVVEGNTSFREGVDAALIACTGWKLKSLAGFINAKA